jgi:protoheme IX farnesyltransferase
MTVLPKAYLPGTTILARLIRLRLSLAVAAAALAGLLLEQPRPGGTAALTLFLGVWALAAGASALNQLQEQDIDARMLRTRGRPLPAGQLRPRAAQMIAAGLNAGGLVLLGPGGREPVLLGLTALLCYNGLYTPLKRRTPLALLPGALCGAIPVLIGWSFGGGSPGDFRILLVAALLYLWQLPHFWRLADKNAADYRRADLPLLQDRMTEPQAGLVRAAWTLALAVIALMLPLFGLLTTTFGCGVLLGVVLVLVGGALGPLRPGRPGAAPRRPVPAWPDLCLLLMMLLLLGERLLLATDPGLLARL